jgi:hypothetical protein
MRIETKSGHVMLIIRCFGNSVGTSLKLKANDFMPMRVCREPEKEF